MDTYEEVKKHFQLTEKAIAYLDGLDPAERQEMYQGLQERMRTGSDGQPNKVETLEELTARLAELNRDPRRNRKEAQQVSEQLDRTLAINAEKDLALFINSLLEKGGVIDTQAISRKAKSLGLQYVNVDAEINKVMRLRQSFQRG